MLLLLLSPRTDRRLSERLREIPGEGRLPPSLLEGLDRSPSSRLSEEGVIGERPDSGSCCWLRVAGGRGGEPRVSNDSEGLTGGLVVSGRGEDGTIEGRRGREDERRDGGRSAGFLGVCKGV